MTVTPVTKAPRHVRSSRKSKSALARVIELPLSKSAEAVVSSSFVDGASNVQKIVVEGLCLRLALEDVRADGAGQDLAELHTHQGAGGVARHTGVVRFLQRANHLGV